MALERVLLVVDPAAALTPMLRAARRVVPQPAHLHVVVLGAQGVEALTPRHADEPMAAVFEALGVGSVETIFDPAQIAAVARRHESHLVVVGAWPNRSPRSRALTLVELASSQGFDVLSVGARCSDAPGSPGRVGLSLQVGSTALGPTTAVVRALPGLRHVSVLVRGAALADLEHLEAPLQGLLPGLALELVPLAMGLSDGAEALEREAVARSLELLVVASSEMSNVRQVLTGLSAAHALEESPVPLLILHRGEEPIFVERLSMSDTLRLRGRACAVAVERTSAMGRSPLLRDETFALAGSEGTLGHDDGVVQVPPEDLPTAGASFALSAGDQVATARVLPARPLVLIDAAFPLEQLVDVEVFAPDHACVVVRLRADETLEALRARFDAANTWGAPLGVLDASAWLDDAGGSDVPQAVDSVRFLRLATHLVAGGARVAALVTSDGHALQTDHFLTWTASSLRTRNPLAPLSRLPPEVLDVEARWRWLTGAALVPGHAAALELDNHLARTRLLSAIDAARTRVHWQTYIVEDDPTTTAIGGVLLRAAKRGVTVRVLVDALYSQHEAFGVKNPFLERLATTPGVEVRGIGRFDGLPSLADLKRRNHRKLVLVDGAHVTVSGRNVGATYYRGFDEVPLTRMTEYRDVPWLDASLALEGPLVETAERAFLDEWTHAGGAPFVVQPVAPRGELACRLVMHEGLLDGHALEAQLELAESARHRLVLVNTFPLLLELQRALIRAVRRGVQVQFLFGNVRPRWGEDVPFVGGSLRELADELVRSRLDPVLRAGAEGYEYGFPHPDLGRVFPHVHAKLYTRDDDLVAVGSANVDVTSAYWESEALVLVHDAGFAAKTLASLDALLATSRRVDLTAPSWSENEARRDWLSRNWPSLMS